MNRLALTALVVVAPAVAGACSDQTPQQRLLAARTSGGGAPLQVTQSFAMPLRATTLTDVSQCDNSPGPYITIQGEISLGGLGTRMVFTNNVKGTHSHTDGRQVDVAVVPAGDTIVLPKQPVNGGVGGNPFIWIKLEDGNGNAVSEEIYLGRCVQGFRKNVSIDFGTLARALANIAVDDCANSPGPHITFDGDLTIASGLDAKFIFRNNDNPVGGPHEAVADAVVAVSLLAPGHVVRFSKQPVRGGVGGNPWIWFGFLDGAGAPLEDLTLLGRCEQLSKATG